MKDFSRLVYTSVLLPEAPQELTIDAKAMASFSSHTNMATMDEYEIGRYQKKLDAPELELLTTILAGSIIDLPDHSSLVIPSGVETQMVTIEIGDQTIKKIISAADPVAPETKIFFDQLEAMVTKVRKGPIQTIQLKTVQIGCKPNDILETIIEVKNSGKEVLFFRSPANIILNNNGQLFVETWPETALPGSMWSEQKIIVTPKMVELIDSTPPQEKKQPELDCYQLRPGEALRFRLTGGFKGQTSGYIGRIYMNNSQDSVGEQKVILGEIYGSQKKFLYPSLEK